MDYEAIKADLRNPNIVIPTPFSPDTRTVEHDALTEQIAFLREAGTKLFIPCGGLSEYYSLSRAERIEVVRTTVDAVGDAGSVIAGIGGGVGDMLDLVDKYEAAGVDGLMVIYPYTNSDDIEGLQAYYREIIEATELAVMFYKSDPGLTHEVIEPFAGHENVVAVKYSVNDVQTFAYEVDVIDEDLVWVAGGGEDGIIPFAREGADGFTTGIGNFAPELSHGVMAAVREGDLDRARRLRRLTWPYSQLRRETNGVAAIKYGQQLAGLYGGPVRPPHVDLDPAGKQRAKELYEYIQSELPTGPATPLAQP